MQVLNYTEFRKNLTKNLKKVNKDKEIVIVSRSKGKNVVVMSLEEYNSINETLHLITNSANKVRLEEAIQEMEKGQFSEHSLLEQ